jgi:molybdopterin adenylyltransferase
MDELLVEAALMWLEPTGKPAMTDTSTGTLEGFVPLAITVLTISDTRGLAEDRSGDTLQQRIVAAGHSVAARILVRDDVATIRQTIAALIADETVPVVITTGGTGLTGRDVTPEAAEPLFEKRLDGFSFLFHQMSEPKIGAATLLSRATAGIANGTLVFCLPGSPSACRDAWDHIIGPQLDARTKPNNLVLLRPRFNEHKTG